MKRALLIGVADKDPEHPFLPEPSLVVMEDLLEELGGWTTTRVDGPSADRAGILAALVELARTVQPKDTCLVYFIGHGGIVEIMDLPPPLGRRPVFYVCAARPSPSWSFEGILDVELSIHLAQIDRVCGNVTAILDSCYSARAIRGPLWQLHESPQWVREVAAQLGLQDVDSLLSVTSHPRIVRLAASSSLRKTFADPQPDGHLGRLTRMFDETVREAELQLERLTWDALAHRVRERAIWRLGCEEQWVSLVGPRQRLLFSRREVELPRTVGFVPRENQSGGWIRAGALQGVQVGDEWALADLQLQSDGQPQLRGQFRVAAVGLNRAELEPVRGADSAPPGASAMLLRARERMPVFVEAPPSGEDVLARSAWLVSTPVDSEAAAKLCIGDDWIDVYAAGEVHAPARFCADRSGRSAAVTRLEDWARARVLLSVSSSYVARASPPLSVEFGRYQVVRGRLRPRTSSPSGGCPRLHDGDRFFVRVAHVGGRSGWFISAVEVDVAGRPALLDASEPDGRELLAGERATIGERSHRRVQGIQRSWPEGVAPDRARVATIIVLASRRPIQLGHLVRGRACDLALPRDAPRPRRARVRGFLAQPRPRTGPELTQEWFAASIPYELDPRPRAASDYG
ncbi:hypothetical protein ENSA5_18980 [Enhygromyxa salina]|uniref:Caspase domain protein n=1 Tax=Enhygromyxa salina TaxID=215803 RepID=A0A2S9YCX8_9BACT|nr:caspase family protein [Enhygromyxa salina]PRQ02959.1 hypothetical protein ENSA5_18980 [Enhygromyxa salina]